MTRTLSIAALIATLAPSAAFAQNPPPPPPKHETTAELAFVGVTGNASTNTFGAGYETIARPNAFTFRHRLAFVRNESGGTLTAKSFLYTPRIERAINSRVGVFGEYAYFRDRFAGVSGRNSITGGLTATIASTARHTLKADAGVGYLNESRLAGADISSATYGLGTNYALKLSPTADLSDEFRLIGVFDDGEDFRITHAIALTARLTSTFSLKVSNGIRFANAPTPGFKKTDSITSVALVAKWSGQ